MEHHDTPNRWQGLVLGIAGGALGTMAMGGYWKAAQALTGEDPRTLANEGGSRPFDDISLVGTHHSPEESSTAAMGRIAYEQLAGKPPESEETKSTLSYVVHYGYGSLQGGLYGATRSGAAPPDVPGGLAFGTGMWLFGDELGASLLGLADGPSKFPPKQHLHRLAAHLVYGLTVAATTRVLHRLL